MIILLVIVFIVFISICYMFFNSYHATKGMINANLYSYFAKRTDNLEESISSMIKSRYFIWPFKLEVFENLWSLIGKPIIDGKNLSDVPFLKQNLRIVFSKSKKKASDYIGLLENERRELQSLMQAILLMHLFESGSIYRLSGSNLYRTDKFIDKFLSNIYKKYHSKIQKLSR
jgi:hypothetical protein